MLKRLFTQFCAKFIPSTASTVSVMDRRTTTGHFQARQRWYFNGICMSTQTRKDAVVENSDVYCEPSFVPVTHNIRKSGPAQRLSWLTKAESWEESSPYWIIHSAYLFPILKKNHFRENHLQNAHENFFWNKSPQVKPANTFFVTKTMWGSEIPGNNKDKLISVSD